MKILFTPDHTGYPQDNFEFERLLIVKCYQNITNYKELKALLSDWRSFNHYDCFNLNLWITVLNTLDLAMREILDEIHSMCGIINSDNKEILKDYRSTLEVIIIWSTSFLRHSFNTSVYNSTEVMSFML